jgi:hypothetical protein
VGLVSVVVDDDMDMIVVEQDDGVETSNREDDD